MTNIIIHISSKDLNQHTCDSLANSSIHKV